ncbi:Uncharacterized protein HZ326_28695 [Fusarium oxysporum f. sp. albedinis]|nr:Uncharacterized protein HZ326_28695 [Fusarium oxysporum f. sp. albedinis]
MMTSGPRRSVGHMPGPTFPFSHPRPAGREVGAVDTTEQPVLNGMRAFHMSESLNPILQRFRGDDQFSVRLICYHPLHFVRPNPGANH